MKLPSKAVCIRRQAKSTSATQVSFMPCTSAKFEEKNHGTEFRQRYDVPELIETRDPRTKMEGRKKC